MCLCYYGHWFSFEVSGMYTYHIYAMRENLDNIMRDYHTQNRLLGYFSVFIFIDNHKILTIGANGY